MLKNIMTIIGLCCTFAFTACQKVISLDLRTAPPVYVIEGNVTDQPGPYQVQIIQTTGFYAANTFSGVPGAAVSIADEAGHSENLTDNTFFEISTTQNCVTPVNFTSSGTGKMMVQTLKTTDGEGVIFDFLGRLRL